MFSLSRVVAGGASCLLFLACSNLAAVETDGQQPSSGEQIVAQHEQRIEAALAKRGEWSFVDVPLRDALDEIQDRLQINVYLDVRALEDYGIGTDTPVTITLAGTTHRSFLNLLLRKLDLSWSIQDGLLWISTFEELEARLITRVYPVGDLTRVTKGADAEYDYETLAEALTSSIAPASWDSAGGPGSIEGLYSSLVVSQTREVHEQIANLLEGCRQLAQQLPEQGPAAVSPVILGDAANPVIRAELEKPTTLRFHDVPLRDVADRIRARHDIPVVIDTRALEDYGIGTDTPITFQTEGLPLRNALRVLLSQLDLTFMVRDEVLMITTLEEAEAMEQVRLYPVGDLVITPLEASQDERYLDDLGTATNYDFDSLIETINSTVAPESWAQVGGPGAIEVLNNPAVLVISQTEYVHEEIPPLLGKLRRAKSHETQRLARAARAGTEDPEYFIKAYTLMSLGPEETSTGEIIELLRETLGARVWSTDRGAYLQGVGSSLVVRHTPQVHRQVQRLLQEVRVWSPSFGLPGGQFGPAAGPQSMPAFGFGGFGGGGGGSF